VAFKTAFTLSKESYLSTYY